MDLKTFRVRTVQHKHAHFGIFPKIISKVLFTWSGHFSSSEISQISFSSWIMCADLLGSFSRSKTTTFFPVLYGALYHSIELKWIDQLVRKPVVLGNN